VGDFRYVVGDRVKTITPCEGPSGIVRYRRETDQGPIYAVRWCVTGTPRQKQIATDRNSDDNGNAYRYLEGTLAPVPSA